jgi:hypothetical protein
MNVFDIVNSLSSTKKLTFEENDPEMEKEYHSFLVNKAFSYYPDTIMHSNEMNLRPFISKRMQHNYYHNSLRSRKRYTKWLKKTKNEDIELIQKYFNFSKKKAIEALKILSDKDISCIREEMSEGGAQT